MNIDTLQGIALGCLARQGKVALALPWRCLGVALALPWRCFGAALQRFCQCGLDKATFLQPHREQPGWGRNPAAASLSAGNAWRFWLTGAVRALPGNRTVVYASNI